MKDLLAWQVRSGMYGVLHNGLAWRINIDQYCKGWDCAMPGLCVTWVFASICFLGVPQNQVVTQSAIAFWTTHPFLRDSARRGSEKSLTFNPDQFFKRGWISTFLYRNKKYVWFGWLCPDHSIYYRTNEKKRMCEQARRRSPSLFANQKRTLPNISVGIYIHPVFLS